MQVGDGLPAVGTVVDDQAISGIRHAFAPCDFRRGKQQVPEQGRVIRLRGTHAGQWFARDDQNVQRRLRGNVPEGHAEFIAVNDVRRDLAVADFFEKGLGGHARKRWHDSLWVQVLAGGALP